MAHPAIYIDFPAKKRYDKRGDEKMTELFSRYINSPAIRFKHSKGVSDRSGKEFHLFHEIILFLGGDAELISETVRTPLKPLTLIVIPKETYHQVLIKGRQDDYCRCVFQFYQTPGNAALIESSVRELFVTESDDTTRYLFSTVMALARNQNDATAPCVTEAVLNLLLYEIKEKKAVQIIGGWDEPLTKQTIAYISERLTQPLQIEDIARHLNVSPSTLMHTFRRKMNISIHKYILQKRLILAHNMIADGEQAIVAAGRCGFHDYSGFYKQYVKMFNMKPSGHVKK